MEGVFFLLELVLLGAAGLLALAGFVFFGGARRNGVALLAVGLYALAAGLALSVVPLLRWPVATTDNAFMGHFLFTAGLVPLGLLLAIGGGAGLRSGGRGRAGVLALALSGVGTACAVALLLARGPEPWQTRPTSTFGSGTFGFDIILAWTAIGAAVFLLGRRLGRPGDVDA
ncbi:MAG: hypothetical protein M3Q65_22225 [Chloroflexota bacterium]|nr:hypothetical protein [Chloroflexota bacterium]